MQLQAIKTTLNCCEPFSVGQSEIKAVNFKLNFINPLATMFKIVTLLYKSIFLLVFLIKMCLKEILFMRI